MQLKQKNQKITAAHLNRVKCLQIPLLKKVVNKHNIKFSDAFPLVIHYAVYVSYLPMKGKEIRWIKKPPLKQLLFLHLVISVCVKSHFLPMKGT